MDSNSKEFIEVYDLGNIHKCINILYITLLITISFAVSGCGNNNEHTAEVTAAPIAKAGAPQSISTGTTVTLDGSASNDSNNDYLSFHWSMIAKPAGSKAVLSNASSRKTTFTADIAGIYICALTVNDGHAASSTSVTTVTATTQNLAPAANAGSNRSGAVGIPVQMDGSASSDPEHDQLKYYWKFSAKPVGSNAVLANSRRVNPDFVPDVAGDYVLSLTVSDGQTDSKEATAIFTASLPGQVVTLETSMGIIKIALYENFSPVTTANFLNYVSSNFYDSSIFHRVIADFMIQGGGFTPTMTQKTTSSAIANEAANGLKNVRGSVAMARTSDINSATSQFFINVKDNSFLDHVDTSTQRYGYAVFGYVIAGMDVVDNIAAVATGSANGMNDVPTVPVIINSATVTP